MAKDLGFGSILGGNTAKQSERKRSFSIKEIYDNASPDSIKEIDINLIDDFPAHPFKVRMDENMSKLINSIVQNGVLTPVLLVPEEGGRYKMVSGHRRKFAAKEAGLETIPAIIKELGENEAIVLMVDANLQRDFLLPSERAWAYKMKMDAMKHQGKRTDLVSGDFADNDKLSQSHVLEGQDVLEDVSEEVLEKSSMASADIIGKEMRESARQVFRYIRLTELIPELLQEVDNKRLKVVPAVALSYIDKDTQKLLSEEFTARNTFPSPKQATELRKAYEAGNLDEKDISAYFAHEKEEKKEPFKVTKKMKSYIPKGQDPAEYVLKALAFYNEAQAKNG